MPISHFDTVNVPTRSRSPYELVKRRPNRFTWWPFRRCGGRDTSAMAPPDGTTAEGTTGGHPAFFDFHERVCRSSSFGFWGESYFTRRWSALLQAW